MKLITANKAWVVAADMGLGHQRAAHPLRAMAEEEIITAGAAQVASPAEYHLWNRIRAVYNFLSRAGRIPIVGPVLFKALHLAEEIPQFYPDRDLSGSALQPRLLKRMILRHDMGGALLKKCREKRLPLVTTFYATALAADYLGYPEPIYCVICDTDINRAWVADDPSISRIQYFAPCESIVSRLRQYGVKPSNIYLTGFPLPRQNTGVDGDNDILKKDLGQRLLNLDPEGIFRKRHALHLSEVFGGSLASSVARPLSITFAIGGAGAQAEIAFKLLKSLRVQLLEERLILYVSAGIRQDVVDRVRAEAVRLGLAEALDRSIRVVYAPDCRQYCDKFNKILRVTDILWTKPSELTFYCALGIPVIMAPCIGPHETANRKWLLGHHAGLSQEDPRYAAEWLDDWLRHGVLAEAAWDAFLKCPRDGTSNIESIVAGDKRLSTFCSERHSALVGKDTCLDELLLGGKVLRGCHLPGKANT